MNAKLGNFLTPIRPTVRAVIIRNGRLLAQVKHKTGQQPHYALPGGKQEPGETAAVALARECAEEIGANIVVGELIHIAEVLKPKQEGIRHQLELLFACQVPDDYSARNGPHPDPSQIDTIWASKETWSERFRPDYVRRLTENAPVYLGVFDG